MNAEDKEINHDKPSCEISDRVVVAEEYFEQNHNLGGQRSWYSKKASKNKSYHQWLGLLIIIAGAGIGIIQLWSPRPPDAPLHWTVIITALLGASVVISKGIERIWDFDGTWLGYRKASETMKRERRLFINGAVPYDNCTDDRQAFLLLIKRVEEVIAEEQNNYWSNQDSTAQPQAEGK